MQVTYAKNMLRNLKKNTFESANGVVSIQYTTVMQFSWAEYTAVVLNICQMQLLER